MAQIAVGSKLNLNGAVRTLDATSSGLKSLKFLTGGGGNPGTPGQFSQMTHWYSDGNVQFGQGTAAWSSLSQNSEIEAVPNQDAMTLLGITDLYSLNSDGNLVIQPRLLKPAEKATVNAAGYGNATWLSGSIVTRPYGIGTPYLLGARIQLPTPYLQGLWVAVWLLKTVGGWPPEMDILEAVNYQNSGLALTSTMHWGSNNQSQGQTNNPPFNVNDGAFHDYFCVMYDDFTTVFLDGIAVGSWATSADWQGQNAYMILDYAIAGPGNGWPGPLPAGTTHLSPLVIADAIGCVMPANYGTGTPVTYVAPSGPAAIPFGAGVVTPPAPPMSGVESVEGTTVTAPSNAVIIDAIGDHWGINAAGQIMLNGVIDGITNSVVALVYHAHQVWQNAWSSWWSWNGTAWIAQAAAPVITVTPPPPPPPPPPVGVTVAELAPIKVQVTTMAQQLASLQVTLTSLVTALAALKPLS